MAAYGGECVDVHMDEMKNNSEGFVVESGTAVTVSSYVRFFQRNEHFLFTKTTLVMPFHYVLSSAQSLFNLIRRQAASNAIRQWRKKELH